MMEGFLWKQLYMQRQLDMLSLKLHPAAKQAGVNKVAGLQAMMTLMRWKKKVVHTCLQLPLWEVERV
jgi:hypothetical protein